MKTSPGRTVTLRPAGLRSRAVSVIFPKWLIKPRIRRTTMFKGMAEFSYDTFHYRMLQDRVKTPNGPLSANARWTLSFHAMNQSCAPDCRCTLLTQSSIDALSRYRQSKDPVSRGSVVFLPRNGSAGKSYFSLPGRVSATQQGFQSPWRK